MNLVHHFHNHVVEFTTTSYRQAKKVPREIAYGSFCFITGLFSQILEQQAQRERVIQEALEDHPFKDKLVYSHLRKILLHPALENRYSPSISAYSRTAIQCKELASTILNVIPTFLYASGNPLLLGAMGMKGLALLTLIPVVSKGCIVATDYFHIHAPLLKKIDKVIKISFEYLQVSFFIVGIIRESMEPHGLGLALYSYLEMYTARKIIWYLADSSTQGTLFPFTTALFTGSRFNILSASRVSIVLTESLSALAARIPYMPKWTQRNINRKLTQKINDYEERIQESTRNSDPANAARYKRKKNALEWIKSVKDHRVETFEGSTRVTSDEVWMLNSLNSIDENYERYLNNCSEEVCLSVINKIEETIRLFPKYMRYRDELPYIKTFQRILTGKNKGGNRYQGLLEDFPDCLNTINSISDP